MVGQTVRRSSASPTRAIALVCGVVLALGAYGFAATPASAAAKLAVKTATVPGVGTVLVDSTGHTLYTLTNNGVAVACTGVCLSAWPPLTVAATATKVKAAKGIKALGVTADTHQVTAKGLPLYRFSGDTAAKQANGEGITAFGGTWHVVTPSGAAAKKTTSTPTSSAGIPGY